MCRGTGIESLVAPAGGLAERLLAGGRGARPRGPRGAPTSGPTGGVRGRAGEPEPNEAELVLFERLRVLRKSIADREGVPAYIVFSDAVLRQLALRRPRAPEELLGVPGIGPAKLERYGAAFLELLFEGSTGTAAPQPQRE